MNDDAMETVECMQLDIWYVQKSISLAWVAQPVSA